MGWAYPNPDYNILKSRLKYLLKILIYYLKYENIRVFWNSNNFCSIYYIKKIKYNGSLNKKLQYFIIYILIANIKNLCHKVMWVVLKKILNVNM